MTNLETILTKFNFPKRTTSLTPTFTEIENQIDFLLPDDYKFFLENYTGHQEFVGPELVTLWDFDDLLEFNKDYGVFDNLSKTIAIGNNPSSEFIGIECLDNKNYRVVLSPFIDLDREYHITIGDSFTDFFERLDNGKEWFN
jgi:ribulose bisphosphate carboxylase small subunit